MQLKYWVAVSGLKQLSFDAQHTISVLWMVTGGGGKQEDAGRKLITSHTMH